MATRFASSLPSSARVSRLAAVVGVLLLAGWTTWFFGARLAVYEVSRGARLEVDVAPHHVDAPVSGRVVESRLVLGAEVAAGDVLVRLDDEAYKLELSTHAARLASLDPQIAALNKELSEDARAARGEGLVAAAARDEAEARRRASESLAALKVTERTQIETLREQRFVAELESARTRSEAEQRSAEAEAARTGIRRLGGEVIVRKSDRRARMARLELEIAQLAGLRDETAARIRVLKREIELRTVRAPVAGRLGDVPSLRPGAVVEAGTRLTVVVPKSGVRAVAYFEPSAVGRLAPAQRGRLRLTGFPWTKYGALAVRVGRVGSEPRDGLVRVELEVSREPGATAPFEHGLPGVVEIEVERVSPAALALDAAGRFVTRVDADQGVVAGERVAPGAPGATP